MKVAFLSTFAFDANVSLISKLNEKCDIYFFTEALFNINYIDKDKLTKFISKGDEVDEIKRFENLIPLDKTYVIKGARQRDLFKKIYNSYNINKAINKINPDIIVLDNCLLTYFVTVFKRRKNCLLLVHDPFFHSGEKNLLDILLRKFYFSILDNKLILNENQKEEFIAHYKENPEKIFSSFLGVYEYLTYYQKPTSQQAKTFNVLFFGRISPYKGIKFLLDAIVDIITNHHGINVTLTVAGSGSYDFDISSYYNYSQIKIINKFTTQEELAELIKQASVVVCPYIDATQSGVVMSSFAFQKPVIATNVGGLPEMVKNNVTGIIVEPKNSEDIKDAILKLYQSPDMLSKMSENIKNEYFEGGKSWEKSAELFMNAFETMQKTNNHN